MTPLDFLLLFILASYVWVGLATGLIQSIGSLLGVVFGAFAASHWYQGLVSGESVTGSMLAFIFLFIVVSRGIGLVFALINRLFNLAALLPGVKLTNALGGALFGFLEGTFAVGITLHFLSRLPLSESITDALNRSLFVPYFVALSGWLVGLLPEVLRQAESVFKKG